MNGAALRSFCYGLLASGVALAAAVDAATGDGEEQVLRSAAGYKSDHDASTLRAVDTLEEVRIAPGERVTRAKGDSSPMSAALLGDHWIYDAGVDLFFDADSDGYFRYLRVWLDVDSYYDHAWVYAKLYLSADGELWELYHETDDFRVDGASAGDEYEVETELVASYPSGLYDVLIELYDADTGEFVDEMGPAQSSAFSLLPLEDRGYDLFDPPPVVVSHDHGGGALEWPTLLLLAAAAIWRLPLGRRAGGR